MSIPSGALVLSGAAPSSSASGVYLPILPKGASVGAEIDLVWSSIINQSEGGISGRSSLWDLPQRQFHLTIGPLDVAEVRACFQACRGSRYPVAVKDWSDYAFTDERLDWTVSSGTTRAQLQQKFRPATGQRAALYQPILVPDQTEVALTFKINGSPLTTGETWTVLDYGVVVFNFALSSGDVLTASGRKLIPACFVGDTLTVKVLLDGTMSIQDVQLREIFQAELQQLTS